MESLKVLFYGYGNPGRQDDGLGNSFIESMEKWCQKNDINWITFDSNYQLNIEDAELISEKDLVLFIDASIEEISDFYFSKVEASDAKVEFSMHAVSAAYVLDLCQKLYKKFPETYLLHIKGFEWDFKEELSKKAKVNLQKAISFTQSLLINKNSLNLHKKLSELSLDIKL